MKTLVDFLRSTKTQTIGFYIIIIGGMLFLSYSPASEKQKDLMGYIMITATTFYYGSSKGSSGKDETIANLSGK